MKRIKVTPNRVAAVAGAAYAVLVLIRPPVQGARIGAAIALVSLVLIFAIGYWSSRDRDRY